MVAKVQVEAAIVLRRKIPQEDGIESQSVIPVIVTNTIVIIIAPPHLIHLLIQP